ncbi:unnamed protein product [Caenorhabditis sp. 36 PRJEB53466]|nr:unnamed protein product [Caenorhabditis sp. 36 PRJEB53466]
MKTFEAKMSKEVRLSYNAIDRLANGNNGNNENIRANYKWSETIQPNMSFEIGVWKSVPVETSEKKKRRRKKQEEEEKIDLESIDYESHLTPKIENMKKPLQTPPKKPNTYVNTYQQEKPPCFCYLCLIRLNLSTSFPRRFLRVAHKVRMVRLIIISNATERLFIKMIKAMIANGVPRPPGVSYTKVDYRVVLEFFEAHCKPEIIDLGVMLNDQLAEIKRNNNMAGMKRLHEVFKALVFASCAKVLFKILLVHVPNDTLHKKSFLFVRDIMRMDPLRFLQMDQTAPANLDKNFLRLY